MNLPTEKTNIKAAAVLQVSKEEPSFEDLLIIG